MNLAPILRQVGRWAGDALADAADAQHGMAARRLAAGLLPPLTQTPPPAATGSSRCPPPIRCSMNRPRASGTAAPPTPLPQTRPAPRGGGGGPAPGTPSPRPSSPAVWGDPPALPANDRPTFGAGPSRCASCSSRPPGGRAPATDGLAALQTVAPNQ